jgi:2-polyprenyl-6-hydroxyphenyl methylase/3-demethylubiquinone-9 3-methyltransferase
MTPMTRVVDNDIYRRRGHAWWDEAEGMFASIRYFVNPVRFGYFKRVLASIGVSSGSGRTILDVGCGGGLLSEEFAKAGWSVTGIDPADESIVAARQHAGASRLPIVYLTSRGESLPFPPASFDAVVCCDVLEHVEDVGCVVEEIARVLKPGGWLFYDTINRTFMSWVTVIKAMQDWRSTAFADANAHVWAKFIRPRELEVTLTRHGLTNREFTGMGPQANPVSCFLNLRRRARGEITYPELGRRMHFGETRNLQGSYLGWAVRG